MSIVLLTVGILVVGYLQYTVYSDQARLMKQSLGQNERSVILGIGQLAVANRNAKSAEDTSDDNKRQFQQTLKQMKIQGRVMEKTADSQIAANRAWMVPNLPPRNLAKIQDAIIEWRNIGKTPATNVFFWREYFQGAIFPSRMSTCAEMVSEVKKKPLNVRQFKAFVAEGGTYEFGLTDPPPWPNPQQPFISIHGCVWYTDIASNTEKSVEFFYLASQMKYSTTRSDTVFIGIPTHKPFIYK